MIFVFHFSDNAFDIATLFYQYFPFSSDTSRSAVDVLYSNGSNEEITIKPHNSQLQTNASNISVIPVNLNEPEKIFKILPWTGFFSKTWMFPGRKDLKRCAYNNCEVFHDHQRLDEADAVLVHMRSIDGISDLPPYHIPSQKWIMAMHESPMFKEIDYTQFNDMFNATWTYSARSDIYDPHGFTVRLENPAKELDVPAHARHKNKLVAWFVSNCDTPSKRELFVRELQKYIPIDIVGECGPYKCPIDQQGTCHQILERDYKFYLAFENSICEGYATEKVWKVLTTFTVPIVLGGHDYKTILPPNSFIDILDFPSSKHLAEHILNVSANDTLYNSFFKWKKDYEVIAKRKHKCRICEYLNKSSGKTKIYGSLDTFWNEQAQCLTPLDYYRNTDELFSL